MEFRRRVGRDKGRTSFGRRVPRVNFDSVNREVADLLPAEFLPPGEVVDLRSRPVSSVPPSRSRVRRM
jgi:hypothetical protein